MVPILIVSAEEELRRRIAGCFDGAGYVSHAVDDVASAVSCYGDLENPVVVLQIDSEHLDGLSALQSLKRVAIRPKIVAVCSGKNERTARLLLAAGASAVADLSTDICAVSDSVARLIADR